MKAYININYKTEYEGLTITHGHYSDDGNYLGVCIEKASNHPPLHVYKAQMATYGWENEPELPFFALGKWKEIANKPGEFRFTALSIWKEKEDCEKAMAEQDSLDKEIEEAIEKKKRELGL